MNNQKLNKKVSVIIPLYNAEKYIARTLQSILNQTYQNIEIIIVDDESPDNSVKICQQFNDSQIKIIHQKNRGLPGARNTGIRHATGEYIAFMDADDIWLPEKLNNHIIHLENNPDVGVSFSRSAFIDETDKPLGIYQITKLHDITPLDILCRSPIGNGSAAVFKKAVFEDIKFQANLYGYVEDYYFDDTFMLSEDIECWVRIALTTKWKFAGLAQPLTLYRVHSQGLSTNLKVMLDSREQLFEKTSSYAPKEMATWIKPARAYHLRYVARRAITINQGILALKLMYRSLANYWPILIEDFQRTFETITAAVLLCIVPKPLYDQIKSVALKIIGNLQKKSLNQDSLREVS
ncbi:MAG: glycosyltransferase family 2 protein [Richelia sp. RM2_1_2]|nr:glycosyltransferase family 2 protein [Richelia sp. SM2_1_7]NJM20611.1 glycosyltransferase family 2 protein [Richelia sp. SM1_7_0]NJN07386.1 glycosyltransferase family 2 protein [Richelia sp. RM1_1_1]NJO29186.1 glycosyltransferase family 2 protein [Richelia sp. SL_2_1]NJO57489.1 glycosyltransferase family 2 protein [Richelia sp. RM2_1_2]